MNNLTETSIVMVALSPLALLLSIWSIEYMLKKLMLVGGWLLGTIGLLVIGPPHEH